MINEVMYTITVTESPLLLLLHCSPLSFRIANIRIFLQDGARKNDALCFTAMFHGQSNLGVAGFSVLKRTYIVHIKV
jgi:hypothetical protein